jgi:gamma-glutamyltranspeptidase / glutathione hydrolase
MPLLQQRREFLKFAVGTVAGACPAFALAQTKSPGLVLGQPQGAKAGGEVLAAGGNAVDAAVTAALVAGVVAVPSCGIGGYGGHLVLARPDGQVVAIDFNTAAPAAARPDLFPLGTNGTVKGQTNTYGWLAAGVPGTLAGLHLALRRYGTLPFARAVQPALRYARDGFEVNKGLATAIKNSQARLRRDPGSAKLFFREGEPLREGDTFRNPDLADLLQQLAEQDSVEPFYRGAIAGRIAAAFQANGGLVTAADLAAYHAREVPPLTLDWRGHRLCTAPLTAGGLTVLQALHTLKALGWEHRDRTDPATTHARLEALRLAWNDRLRLLGDPDKVPVPMERLLSDRYAALAAARVEVALKQRRPLRAAGDAGTAGGTIHLSAADGQGMLVALTLTHGNGLGAQVTVDGLGLLLGHGMSRFEPRPGHPNSVGPGKRPLHNMCPTVVLRDGKPAYALGAQGGRRIPNAVFDALVSLVGAGLPLEEAVRAPRMNTEGNTTVTLTADWPAADAAYLKEVGYTVLTGPSAGLNAVGFDTMNGIRSAAR